MKCGRFALIHPADREDEARSPMSSIVSVRGAVKEYALGDVLVLMPIPAMRAAVLHQMLDIVLETLRDWPI